MYYANILQADSIATGHYAEVVKRDNGRFTVRQSPSASKDQSYMLWQLTQEQLSRTLMPLGSFTKDEVRRIAREAGLNVAEKRDSQEICFVPDGDYADFIEANAADSVSGDGNFVDERGNILGRHKGVIHYTVGQRKGLGIALGEPVYVSEIRTDSNEVVLGNAASLLRKSILCRNVNWMGIDGIPAGGVLRARVKIRYHDGGTIANITEGDGDTIRVAFEQPVRAPAPGQSAVFYDADGCVLGGGEIV